ncbi:uncharacterized protein LOC133926531 [Phragmites australis]|uniref:uncharacterized protein LOC133926531 n=1 Tax=Phragmites australis TaxID=29695 RepID=UPI002D7A15F8|nr:uncharacterized protein LOC133926531 [Phragmites australis]
MLHLQKHIPLSFRHQWLLSVTRFAATASAADPAPFAVEDYLVASCHLTQNQALKASKALSHLKSPSNPDAVLAFLSGLGLSPPDIASVVVRAPKFLCCKVDKTLSTRLAALQDHGLSASQIARLVLLNPSGFLQRSIISKLKYYVGLFGSFDDLLNVLKKSSYLLGADLESVVKPNVSCLRECGLGEPDISKICRNAPRLLYARPERVQAMVVRAEGMGVPRSSTMFMYALRCVASRSDEFITEKLEFLKESFRWSEAEVRFAVSRDPWILTVSKDRAFRVSEFLISEVGLDPKYIASTPALIKYSLEGRLIPRHHVVKLLKANRLLAHDRSYYSAVSVSEKVFLEKFICPYKEAAPHLAEDYAASCRGEVPSRFML